MLQVDHEAKLDLTQPRGKIECNLGKDLRQSCGILGEVEDRSVIPGKNRCLFGRDWTYKRKSKGISSKLVDKFGQD